MEIKTYDTILTELCDTFDSYISPKSITRSNRNIVYLLLKAFAKGLETVNNVAVALSNKFDPARCSVEDLDSVATLVGTARLTGSATGLQVIVTNTSETPVDLIAGTYIYKYDSDTAFEFTVPTTITVDTGKSISYIAMSTENKAVSVTAQDSITVTREDEKDIDTAFTFSCTDNARLQGSKTETDLEFRNRIIKGETSSSLIVKMQNEIKNLPYIFDCQCFFNNTPSSVVKGSVTVSPWHLLVCISGEIKPEIAEIITKYSVFPTVVTDTYVDFASDIFTDGYYRAYYKDFDIYYYDLTILYKCDTDAISDVTVEKAFREALAKFQTANTYTDILTERQFSNLLMNLGLSTVNILNVDLYDVPNTSTVDYIEVPITYIATLRNITIARGA
jgi:hypothetical protein